MPAVDSTAHPFGVSIIQSSEIICPYGGKVSEMFGSSYMPVVHCVLPYGDITCLFGEILIGEIIL